MAVGAVNSCSIFRSATTRRPFPAYRSCLFRFNSMVHYNSVIRVSVLCSSSNRISSFGFGNAGSGGRSYSVESLFDIAMEELQDIRRSRRLRATNKLVLPSSGGQLEDKLGKLALQKGLLLEFKKDSDRFLLAVAQKPDGKKNWMVSDQNGVLTSIKPQQITFVVPGENTFDPTDISDFIHKAHSNLDPTLLEFAWVELLEKNKSVTAEELAEMIFGSAEPLESYCAHLLLSRDEIYFAVLDGKGPHSVYGPRSIDQVEELQRRKLAKDAADKEFQEFLQLLKSAKTMPPDAKLPKAYWKTNEEIWHRIESLEAYALDDCRNDGQTKTAELALTAFCELLIQHTTTPGLSTVMDSTREILKAMGMTKAASSAIDLLIRIGYFPVHVNLDLLKLKIRTTFPDEILSAAECLLIESSDPDESDRVDLTHLKVYAIDVDEADELDDALSATRLQDGRIKVWIHVADPACLVEPDSIVDREAMRRGTSIFLPTATYPMFPQKLAMEGMSLKQGELCNAVTVSVILHSDGSIAEYTVENSIIRPTYMLTYESANELLYMNLEEELELRTLSEAAALRLRWRREQGAVETGTLEARVKVTNPDDPEPLIKLYVENQADPAMQLVSEMMILCGEAIATFGCQNKIPLPYRGQPQSDIDISAFAHLPEGPVRSAAIIKILHAAEIDYRKAIRHGVLGIPGYVQFTSPIRRYMDLLSHYQVKAFLRGDSPPFSAGQLEGFGSSVNMHVKVAKKLYNSSLRYWVYEYLRRQPKGKKYRALIIRFIKDRNASLLLIDVGYQVLARVSARLRVGDELQVRVAEADPRNDILSLKEVVQVS